MAFEILGVDVTKSPIAQLTKMCTSGDRVSFVEFLRNVQPSKQYAKASSGTQPTSNHPAKVAGQTTERPARVSTNS